MDRLMLQTRAALDAARAGYLVGPDAHFRMNPKVIEALANQYATVVTDEDVERVAEATLWGLPLRPDESVSVEDFRLVAH